MEGISGSGLDLKTPKSFGSCSTFKIRLLFNFYSDKVRLSLLQIESEGFYVYVSIDRSIFAFLLGITQSMLLSTKSNSDFDTLFYRCAVE